MTLTTPTFLLNAQAMSSPAALATAFSSLSTQILAEPSRSDLIQSLHSELYRLAGHIKLVRIDAGHSFERAAVRSGVGKYFSDHDFNKETFENDHSRFSTFLQNISADLLDRVREQAGIPLLEGAAAVHGGGIVPAVQPSSAIPAGIKIFVEGEELQPEGADRIFPRVADAAQRIPVGNAPEQQALAKGHLEDAIARYLRGLYLPDHLHHLTKHLEAVISGEIGAPESTRAEVVAFLAKGPGHAAAYAEALLSDAILTGQLTSDLITVLPVFQDLEPRKIAPAPRPGEEIAGELPSAEPAPPSAQPAVGTPKDLAQLLYYLRTAHSAELAELAQINPGSFGPNALKRIETVAQVLNEATLITDAKERAEYFAFAEIEGVIPQGYLSQVADPRKISVQMPAKSPRAVPPSWEDPISFYMRSEEFRETVAGIPQATEDYPIEQRIQALREARETKSRLSDSDRRAVDLVEAWVKRDRVSARKGLLKLKLSMLASSLSAAEEDGARGMRDLTTRVLQLMGDGLFAEAEAVLRFANVWLAGVLQAAKKIREIKMDLYLIGETRASKDFETVAWQLFNRGDTEGLGDLFRDIKPQLRGGETRLKAHLAQLSGRSSGSLTVVIEAIRSLAVLESRALRTQQAVLVPSVERLLKEGPIGEAAARALLRKEGLALPGDPGVPALGAPFARGYLPSSTSSDRLLGSGDVPPSSEKH